MAKLSSDSDLDSDDDTEPSDPRLGSLKPVAAKPLSPPGSTSDGWGGSMPLIVWPLGPPLTVEQATTLVRMGIPLAMARLFP